MHACDVIKQLATLHNITPLCSTSSENPGKTPVCQIDNMQQILAAVFNIHPFFIRDTSSIWDAACAGCPHPLDPLSEHEVRRAAAACRAHAAALGLPPLRFNTIALQVRVTARDSSGTE
jgi:Cu2+-containing amine oxidase